MRKTTTLKSKKIAMKVTTITVVATMKTQRKVQVLITINSKLIRGAGKHRENKRIRTKNLISLKMRKVTTLNLNSLMKKTHTNYLIKATMKTTTLKLNRRKQKSVEVESLVRRAEVDGVRELLSKQHRNLSLM